MWWEVVGTVGGVDAQCQDGEEAHGSGFGKDPVVRVRVLPGLPGSPHFFSSSSFCIQHDLHASELLTRTAQVTRDGTGEAQEEFTRAGWWLEKGLDWVRERHLWTADSCSSGDRGHRAWGSLPGPHLGCDPV